MPAGPAPRPPRPPAPPAGSPPAHHRHLRSTQPQKYAAHAGLLPLVRFRADVRGVSPAAAAAASADAAAGAAEPGAAGWVVEWAGADGAVQSEPYDFVVIATGLFNTPERPAWAEGLARCGGGGAAAGGLQGAAPACSSCHPLPACRLSEDPTPSHRLPTV